MQYLTFSERKKIKVMYENQKLSFRSMGRILGRNHSTISIETKWSRDRGKPYDPEEAHFLFLSRQAKKGNTKKLETNIFLREYIIDCLEEDYSPEEISGRIKRLKLQSEIGYVCSETIYVFIYAEENKYLKLWKHLRRHRKKRIEYVSRQTKSKKVIIKNRTSIHDRPPIVNKKKRLGDWEADLMIFSKQKKVLSVSVERKTKLLRIHICENKTKEEMFDSLQATVCDLPHDSVKTITFDNGTENALHYKLKEMFDIETYFCDPYCSWQKGLVENTNMLLRQYLPRSTNLKDITYDELYEIQEKLNNRPRKTLNYLTPNEVFQILSP